MPLWLRQHLVSLRISPSLLLGAEEIEFRQDIDYAFTREVMLVDSLSTPLTEIFLHCGNKKSADDLEQEHPHDGKSTVDLSVNSFSTLQPIFTS